MLEINGTNAMMAWSRNVLPYVGLSMLMIDAASMTLASISGASERESSCERQDKIYDFFFGNFSAPFSHSDGGVA